MQNVMIPRSKFQKLKNELRDEKIRFRDCKSSVIVPQFDEAIHIEETCRDGISPGIAAYIKLKSSDIQKGAPFLWTVPELKLLDLSPPKYLDSQQTLKEGYLCSVDINNSYYQFYRHLSWRGRWPTRKMKYPIGQTFDDLRQWKEARNAVVGIARSIREVWDVGGEREYVPKKPNPFLSPYLWGCLMAVHHKIASVAKTLGAIYIDTDGYLFNREQDAAFFKSWLVSYGIEYKSLEDYNSILYGWQSYKIGKKQVGSQGLIIRSVKPNIISNESDFYKIFLLVTKGIQTNGHSQ